jgi:hypothetical protein
MTRSVSSSEPPISMAGTNRHVHVHRLSWQLHFGQIPRGLWVLHHCDNRVCVRPDHLFLGTSRENINDMVSKHRHTYGQRNGLAKLTDTLVREIRSAHREGETMASIARRFRVGETTISRVVRHETWRHVQ